MGVDIEGYVEVRRTALGYSEGPDSWSGVINVHGLVERNYGLFAALFDKHNVYEFPAPFSHRGLPNVISDETALQVSLIGGSGVEPSWMLWSEIETLWDQTGSRSIYSVQELVRFTKGWRALFDLMATLAEHFGGENARLIGWFDS